MLTLKEAFAYQKYLQNLIDSLEIELARDVNVMQITAIHKKHAADRDAEDFTVDMTANRTFPGNPDDLIRFYAFLIDEKMDLTMDIFKAKKNLPIELDVELANNALRRMASKTLSRIIRTKKRKEVEKDEFGYRMNAEGNQVRYTYEVVETYKEDYDRIKTKALSNRYKEEADRISNEIDKALLQPGVDFTPKISYDEELEDAYKVYLDMYREKEAEIFL